MANATIKFNGVAGLDKQDLRDFLGLGDHGRVQTALDIEVIEQCKAYVPWNNGVLANSPYSDPKSDIGGGVIVYSGPYAHYQYMGIVYAPNYPVAVDEAGNVTAWRSPPGKGSKHPTDRYLQYQQTGESILRGPKWDERMSADHMKDLIRVVQKAMVTSNE